ncbi:hypothetical protein GCM10022223_42190 [Kineosporia mesophila]|uniref:Uncharacterized protein n=1 Tax=Kineosporia mesophila TaxID=566012 RepID=A0ABP6ZZN4_9ACTN|nr:hypothetical protein [Kineosporia mesophila]MCD5355063.1 hypothetical protein [Kineosporia mesophila]
MAVAEGDLTQEEELFELIPFAAGCGSQLALGAQGAAVLDEVLTDGAHVCGNTAVQPRVVSRLRCPSKSRGDVQGQAITDHLCGEQPPDVVRGEADWTPGVLQLGVGGELV